MRSQSTMMPRSASASGGSRSLIQPGSEARELARMSAIRASSTAGLAPSLRSRAEAPKPSATSAPITSVAMSPTLIRRARVAPPLMNAMRGARV